MGISTVFGYWVCPFCGNHHCHFYCVARSFPGITIIGEFSHAFITEIDKKKKCFAST